MIRRFQFNCILFDLLVLMWQLLKWTMENFLSLSFSGLRKNPAPCYSSLFLKSFELNTKTKGFLFL